MHRLQSSFPLPTDAALQEAREVLDAIPTRRLVLVDGLALGGMPELIQREAQRLCMVALVHHPLAMETGLDAVTAAAFAQRRKMLRQSLKSVPGAVDALEGIGIDPQRRAETLEVGDFVRLARVLG